MSKTPLLDVGGIAPDRPVIRVRTTSNPDGSLHELRVSSELSPKEFAEIARMGEAVNRLGSGEVDNIEPAEMELLGVYLDRILEIAVAPLTPLSDEAKQELTVEHKTEIIGAFTEHCLHASPEQTVQPNRATRRKTTKKSTGAK